MTRHRSACGWACFVTVIGLFLAIAFASAAVMILAFFAFLLAVWLTVPAPMVEDEPVQEAPLVLEWPDTPFVEWQRYAGTERRWQ